MILTNPTPLAAKLISAPVEGVEGVPAFVISKETYDIDDGGALSLSQEPVPISVEPIASPFGVVHSEIFPRKDGADFVIEGTVQLPAPRNQTVVTASLGAFTSRLKITGDRTWSARPNAEPIPTAAAPFLEMPISYSRAFGGIATTPMGPLPYTANPGGRGFFDQQDQCVDQPLPNIEWADAAPIRSWRDRPDPAGWGPYPMFWGLRAATAVRLDKDNNVTGMSRSMFNHAHPAMVLPAIEIGERVTVEGVTPQPLTFEIPNLRVIVRWTSGIELGEIALGIDGVFVWIDQRKVAITRRARFRYPFRPGEPRAATLVAHTKRRAS